MDASSREPALVDEAIRRACKLDPGLATRIRGASSEDITAVEDAVGTPLPADYRRFLERLGDEDGGLHLAGDCDTRPRDIISHYRENVATGDEDVPDGQIVVGLSATGGYSITLELGSGRLLHQDRQTLFARSVAVALYRRIFLDLHRAFAVRLDYSCGRTGHTMAEYRAIAEQSGLRPEWYSDDEALCAVGNDVELYLDQGCAGKLALEVRASSEGRAAEVAAPFVERYGLTRIG